MTNIPLNPLELLKSAVAVLDTVPGEDGAEHANVLQLERAAASLIELCYQSGKTADDGFIEFGCTDDNALRHISECDICKGGVRQFFALYPKTEQPI